MPPTVDAGGNEPDGGGRDGGGLVDGGDAGADECVGDHPACRRPNAVTACARGVCVLVECEAPFVDCDGDTANGCEAQLDSLENCGLCGAACSLPGATTRCSEGKCEFVACSDGSGDCDDDTANGCETPLDSITNCGACRAACDAPPRAAPGCAAGKCGVGECLGAYGDCDGDASNGCEEPLASNDHCGGCDTPCAPANAEGNCGSGQCAIVQCTGAAQDCDGLVGNGCEATLDSADNCGACGAACDLPLHATVAACAAGASSHACAVDHRCPPDTPSCVDGAPENGCEAGFADCDGLGNNGCETVLGTLTDCGGCGDGCDEADAVTACTGGNCVRVSCLPGFDDCSGGNGNCLPLNENEMHCGECSTSCTGGGTPNCFGGNCTDQTCATGTADCTTASGCETSVTTTANCGQCGLTCGPYSHASAACTAGRCTIGSCDSGYLDCDGLVFNGCEVDARTAENCGGCKQACSVANGEGSCSTGACKLVQCDEGRADCDDDLSNGCEASTALPTSCGACGNDCTGRPNTLSGGCEDGVCKLVCADGFRDCDGDPQNGCEAALDSPDHCGSCDNDCTALANVRSASCEQGVCLQLMCEPGFGDCDGIASNGCERSTNTQSDCGGCDIPCALPHADASCNNGSCRLRTCNSGYDNCDGDAKNGCEASLNDGATCGSCSNACADGLSCTNGQCHCTSDAQCTVAGQGCCDGVCVDVQGNCFPWPCIPGTSRSSQNCGGCGNTCALWCCY